MTSGMTIRICCNVRYLCFELRSADFRSEAGVRAHLTNWAVSHPFKDYLPHAGALLVAQRISAKGFENVGLVVSRTEEPRVRLKELYCHFKRRYVTDPE
jgi:hypothetical protein